jgi:aryl-alcohol dehydrogenase-like predicted oxidoreductase
VSRARLGVDAIELYLLHVIDPKVPLATSCAR